MTYIDPNIVTSFRHDQFLEEKDIAQVPKISNCNNFGILTLTKLKFWPNIRRLV